MNRPTLFLLLVLAQAAHSIEEYLGRLWAVFAPAGLISRAISINPERGFIMFNVGLVLFGLFAWAGPVRRGRPVAVTLMWIWVVIEVANGVIHPAVAAVRGEYFPGMLTAPVLLLFGLLLGRRLLRPGPTPAAA